MIYGIGHDVVEIERIKVMLNGRNGEKFMRRILTPAEFELPGRSTRSAEFLAGRFAAKEAVSKAFGCGIGQVLGFMDMEILPDVAGKPSVSLSPMAWTRLQLNGPKEYTIHLSITHERHLASAFAVVEQLK
ncbi:holo-ACP synthase [Paenibacillus segetis]|uniref:Holo-[acyl-carrier-protein] synthase n=1 Tax=Paenibacillus segetis TaxID=1325360 RepID=A0ABQ1YVP7_9BACL|nr:holo-ACP synthase [Paenibacillus segetis]GGH38401.1 holo-[acyl-carrier-protein] synthase [Paenibacillus segetis]